MKQIRYRVIHAYQNKSALEFFNIGVIAYTSDRIGYRLINENELRSIHCNLIKRDALAHLLKYLESEFKDVKSFKDIERKHLYYDDFSFSKEFFGKMLYDLNDELASLFRQYVSYKFEHPKIHHSYHEIIKEKSIEIAEKKFRRYIQIDDPNNSIFDMLIRVKRNGKSALYPTIVGSLRNTNDISRAVKAKINENPKSPMFGYLYSITGQKESNAANVIQDIGYKLDDFSNEESINKTFEELLFST
jgi:hypothetical protein